MTRFWPRSLQGRMLLLSAIAIFAALGVAGWAIAGVLTRFVTEGLDRRLDADIALLVTVVDGDGRVDRGLLAQRAAALEAEGGWRWRIVAPAGTVQSTDFPVLRPGPGGGPEAARRPLPAPPDAGLRVRDGQDRDGDAVHARELTLTTRGGPVTVAVSAPRAVIARPVRAAMMPLQLALFIVACLLAAATLVQLRLGLRPVHRLRAQVAAIRAGQASRVDEDQPLELRGLAEELNALATDRAAALATARASAANLAHALKTPVATLALTLRDDPAAAHQVARIDATIRHHLSRARAGTADVLASTAVAPAVADLVGVVTRLHADRGLRFEQAVAGDPVAAIDRQDLDELLGNLLDNAARHAAQRVWVTAAAGEDARWLTLTVADDGPGIPASARERVTQAGVRLDERGEGHGFGLAIVRELATLHGGTLTLDERVGGGLAASVTLLARGAA